MNLGNLFFLDDTADPAVGSRIAPQPIQAQQAAVGPTERQALHAQVTVGGDFADDETWFVDGRNEQTARRSASIAAAMGPIRASGRKSGINKLLICENMLVIVVSQPVLEEYDRF